MGRKNKREEYKPIDYGRLMTDLKRQGDLRKKRMFCSDKHENIWPESMQDEMNNEIKG